MLVLRTRGQNLWEGDCRSVMHHYSHKAEFWMGAQLLSGIIHRYPKCIIMKVSPGTFNKNTVNSLCRETSFLLCPLLVPCNRSLLVFRRSQATASAAQVYTLQIVNSSFFSQSFQVNIRLATWLKFDSLSIYLLIILYQIILNNNNHWYFIFFRDH